MDDRLQPLPSLRVGEHPLPQRGPVEVTVLGEYARAEDLHDRRETVRTGSDHLASKDVGVDHDRTALGE